MTLTAADVADSQKLQHVPLACFGNGRGKPSKNQKNVVQKDIFVPSQALEDFMKKKPEVSHSHH